jgi:hypothetical protein
MVTACLLFVLIVASVKEPEKVQGLLDIHVVTCFEESLKKGTEIVDMLKSHGQAMEKQSNMLLTSYNEHTLDGDPHSNVNLVNQF